MKEAIYTHPKTVRYTEEIYTQIENIAAIKGVTTSEYIRALVGYAVQEESCNEF